MWKMSFPPEVVVSNASVTDLKPIPFVCRAVMVSPGRPGAGEQLLQSYGFSDVERLDVPFAWEFADPELYARALAATGPAYEAIQNVGEAEFHRAAVEQAREQLRSGLPLRADINVVGYLARKPEGAERA